MEPIVIGSVIAALVLGIIIFVFRRSIFSSKMESVKKLMDKNQYKEAIKILKLYINKHPNKPEPRFLIAECYYHLNNFEWSLPEYKQLLKLNKFSGDYKEANIREKLATIYLRYNQLEEAQKEFILMTQLEPNNYKNYYQIGKIFNERNYQENALQYFKKALQLNPHHAASLFAAGEISYNYKRYNEAINFLSDCVKVDPSYHKAHYFIGLVYMHNKNFTRAIQDFDIAARDNDYRLSSLLQKGICYMELGELQKAIVELERGIGLITEENSLALAIRYNLALCLEAQRDIPAAIKQWERIAKIRPNYQDVQEKLQLYSELRIDDKLKDFMIASNNVFKALSQEIIETMGLQVNDIMEKENGYLVEAIASEPESKWRNTRRMKNYIRIYRANEPIGETTIREIMEEMKTQSAVRGYCVTTSDFTRSARDFAETRPVVLVDQKGLSKLLQKKPIEEIQSIEEKKE